MSIKLSKKRKTVLLIVFLLFLSGVNYLLLGKPQQTNELSSANSVPNFWGLAFKTIVLLGFVILLIYAVLYLLRRFVYRSTFVKSSKAIEILETVPLLQKKSMCIVKVVDRILVLGISESNVNTLTVIEEPEKLQQWESKLGVKAVKNGGSFAKQLENLLKRNKN